MADSLISKPFSEGAPLDPNALNDLRTDLLNTYIKANSLYNDTKGGQTQSYKYLFNCGQLDVAVAKGLSSPIALDLGTGFEANPAPIVTASVGGNAAPGKDQTTTVYVVSNNGGNYQLYVQSNVAKTVTLYWTAIQKLPA